MSKKNSGGKLSRSETVTVRLDPKLRYLAELAARKQRRTLSSFIEWAVEDSLSKIELHHGSRYNNDHPRTVQDESNALWDVDESERFCRLAMSYPDLLTHDEQKLWKLIKELNMVIVGETNEETWSLWLNGEPIYPAIRTVWSGLESYLARELEYHDLLQIIEHYVRPLSFWIKKQRGKEGHEQDAENPDIAH